MYGASEGLDTLVVEPQASGGQAGSTSLIRNYPGFPAGISGVRLAMAMYRQAWGLGARFLFMRRATGLDPTERGELRIGLSDGTCIRAASVIVATGVTYTRLDVPGVNELLGRGVFYTPAVTEAPLMADQPVIVVGGGNSAGQAAVHLAKYASEVTLVVRGASLATSMSDYLIQELRAAPNIKIRHHCEIAEAFGGRNSNGLRSGTRPPASARSSSCRGLFILIGGRPRTDWLPATVRRDEWGSILTGQDAGADPSATNASSLPGLYAAGDVRRGATGRVAASRRRWRARDQAGPRAPRCHEGGQSSHQTGLENGKLLRQHRPGRGFVGRRMTSPGSPWSAYSRIPGIINPGRNVPTPGGFLVSHNVGWETRSERSALRDFATLGLDASSRQ